MTTLVTINYNETPVLFQSDNAYLNATAIAKSFNKRPETYLKTERTREYLVALSSVTKENQLVIVKQGGNADEQGTWLHPKLAIDFARWLSPDFAVWCDAQIDTLLNKGTVSMKPMSQFEILVQSAQLLLEIDNRVKYQEARQTVMEEKIKRLEYKTLTSPNEFYTVAGYASLRGINVDVKTASALGKRAVKLSKERDSAINKAHSEGYGTVNVYHVDVLCIVFEEYLSN